MSIQNAISPDKRPPGAPMLSRRALNPATSNVRVATNDEYLWLDQQVFDRYLPTLANNNVSVSPDDSEDEPRTIPNTQVVRQHTRWRRPVAFLLHLIPGFVYNAMERRSVYAGSQHPEELRCDLKAKKEEWAEEYPSSLLDRIEEVSFRASSGIKHHGLFVKAAPGKPTLLLSGGNMESLSSIEAFFPLMQNGYGFLNYEYPGYGSTRGTPKEKKLYLALDAARNFLNKEKDVPDTMQIGYGISLGGAVTIDSAANRPFKAVILESTMTSLPDTIRNLIGTAIPLWLADLPRHTRSKFKSIEKIGRITSPLLIMHGTRDPLIPSQAARDLYKKAGTPSSKKWLKLITSSEHILNNFTTSNTIQLFLNQPCLRDE